MSYSAGEALVLSRLQAIAGNVWTTSNSSRGKYGMLNTGKADHYAILRPGSGTNEFVSLRTSKRTYSTIIKIYQSYRDDGTSLENIESYAEAILDQFDAYRKLGDNAGAVFDSSITSFSDVMEIWEAGGNGPRWFAQEFTVTWSEYSETTYAE